MSKKNIENNNNNNNNSSSKRAAFDKVIADMSKKYKDDAGSVIYKYKEKTRPISFVPSGSLELDRILGGGIPVGRIIEVYGPEGSGKTSIALACIAGIQRMGGTAIFVDAEHAFDPVFAESLGVNVDELAMFTPDNAEQTFDGIYELVKTGTVDAVIIDSIAALIPKEINEKSAEKSSMAVRARLLSEQLPKLATVCERWGTTLFCINQVRDSMQMYGPAETTTGGKSLKYYASLRFRVKKDSKPELNSDGVPFRIGVSFNVTKYKLGVGFYGADTKLNFTRGFETASEVLSVGQKLGILERKGTTGVYVDLLTGKNLPITGKDNIIEWLDSDIKALAKYVRAIRERIEQERVSRLEELKKRSERNARLRDLIESGESIVLDDDGGIVNTEQED